MRCCFGRCAALLLLALGGLLVACGSLATPVARSAVSSPVPTLASPTPEPLDSVAAALNEAGPVQALYAVQVEAARSGWTADLLEQAGNLWAEVGDPTRARAYWEAAFAQSPDPALARVLAQADLDAQRWSQAASTLAWLLEQEPDHAWAAFHLGLLRASIDPAEAVRLFRVTTGDLQYRGDAARLIDLLDDVSGDPQLPLRVGLALADMERWPYAELALARAAAADTPEPLALAYTALARDRQGKNGARWIEQALVLAPEDPTVRYVQALHLRAAGDLLGSADAALAAVSLDPENPALLAELGTAYRLLGDLPSAEYWLLSAATASGDDARFQSLLADFYAEEAEHLTADGVAALETRINRLGGDPDARAGLAWAMYRSGRREDALAQLNAALEADPNHPRANFVMGQILAESENPESAREYLERATWPGSPVADEARLALEQLGP